MANSVHIVMTSSAKMPSSCWGRYGNVAVVEVDPDALPPGRAKPSMISTHARGVIQILWHSGPRNIGKTSKCAFERAVAHAEAMAKQLNGA